MRIDRLLWFLRLARTRNQAQEMVRAGHIRRNGRRVERAAQDTAIGDLLVLPLPGKVIAIRLTAMPTRRGPASEAQSCYHVLDEPGANPIAASQYQSPEGTASP